MIKILDAKMTGKSREDFVEALMAKMPNTTAFDPLPEFNVSSSAPLGGKQLGGGPRLGRNNSKTGPPAATKKRSNVNRAD